jgi:hypothetical protein
MYVTVSIPFLVPPFLGPYTLTSKFNDNSQLLFKITTLCDVTPCSLVDRYQHIGGTRCPHLQGGNKTKALTENDSSSDEIRLVPLKLQHESTRLSHLRIHFTSWLTVCATNRLSTAVPKHCLNKPTIRFRKLIKNLRWLKSNNGFP